MTTQHGNQFRHEREKQGDETTGVMHQDNPQNGQTQANEPSEETSPRKRTDRRGFASMDANLQRQIASKGGRAAHQQGVAHEFNSEEARAAGRKGGEAVSRNRQHMAEIGKKGGEAAHKKKQKLSSQI